MATPFKPSAGGAYFRRTGDDEPVLVERTDATPAELAPIVIGYDPGRADEATETVPETPAPQGRKKGR